MGGMVRALALLSAVLALALLPSNLVATALPLLRQEWAASATQMGWVVAAYQVGYAVAVLVILPLTDRAPTARVIAAGAALSAIAFVPFGFVAHDVWSASALRIVAGAGLASVYLPGVRVVSAAVRPDRRGFAVSLYVSAFYVGASLSLWASGQLLSTLDWRGAALVLGLIALLGLPIALIAQRGLPKTGSGRSAVLRPQVLRHGPLLRTILAYSGHSWELYVSRGWLAAFLASVLIGSGLSQVESAADGGKWAALMAGLGTVGVWLGGWLSDRWGRARSAMTIAAASGLLSLTFGFLGGSAWSALVAIGCVYGILLAADSGIYSASVTEHAPEGQLGSAQAAQAFIGFLASAISPVAAGTVLDLGGGYGGAFILGGLASLSGAVILLPLALTAHRAAPYDVKRVDTVKSFMATIEPRRGGGIAVPLPFDPSVEWGAKDRHDVTGTVAGHKVRGKLRQVDEQHYLELGPAWCRDASVAPGSSVPVSLGPEGPQVDAMAPDLATAFEHEPEARHFFESLATFYRKNFMRWIDQAKRPETRARRITETIATLKAGKRER